MYIHRTIPMRRNTWFRDATLHDIAVGACVLVMILWIVL